MYFTTYFTAWSLKKNLAKIIKHNAKIIAKDKNSVLKLSQRINENQLNAEEVASFISFTRNFTLSNRQLSLSVKDYLLDVGEYNMLDVIENTEV